MDPVGPQKGKFSSNKGELKSKLGEENSWESNAPSDLGGGFNKKSGTREADKPSHETAKFQGTVSGNHKSLHGKFKEHTKSINELRLSEGSD